MRTMISPLAEKGLRLSLPVVAAFFLTASGAQALELVMFERAGCGWCDRWNRDVGPVYDKTEEGKRAPLRRVDLDRGSDPGFALGRPVRYTPTFVVVDQGREIGRVTGYLSDDAFWSLLGRIIASVPKPQVLN